MSEHTKDLKFGAVSRSGPTITFDETENMAGAVFSPAGGNKQVNRIYARRMVACVNACSGVDTDQLESDYAEGADPWSHNAHLTARIKRAEQQRDELLAALKGVAPEGISGSCDECGGFDSECPKSCNYRIARDLIARLESSI